jgi:hypothetical protein
LICESCGGTSPEGSKFCIRCGERLSAPDEARDEAVEEPEIGLEEARDEAVEEPEVGPEEARDEAVEEPEIGPEDVRKEIAAAPEVTHPPPVKAPPPPSEPVIDEAPQGEAPEVPPPPPVVVPAEPAPPEPESPLGVVDPADLGPAVARLDASSQRAGRVAMAILSAMLHEGERVESLVVGQYQNYAGVAVLTSERIMLVNDHEWVPDVREIAITADLVVQGWQDDRTASLVFVTEGVSVTISLIVDRPVAQEMAHAIRAKVAALAD